MAMRLTPSKGTGPGISAMLGERASTLAEKQGKSEKVT